MIRKVIGSVICLAIFLFMLVVRAPIQNGIHETMDAANFKVLDTRNKFYFDYSPGNDRLW